jgi:hypothetical protein
MPVGHIWYSAMVVRALGKLLSGWARIGKRTNLHQLMKTDDTDLNWEIENPFAADYAESADQKQTYHGDAETRRKSGDPVIGKRKGLPGIKPR